MPRPRKDRMVERPPVWKSFKPAGMGKRGGVPVLMSIDEYEAIRLADHEGLDHAEAAIEMDISRPTFTRIIEEARKKMADFLMGCRELRIEGGSIHFKGNIFRCLNCGSIIDAEFGAAIEKCPECSSDRLLNTAEGFGHGRCCHGKGRGKNENINSNR